MSVHNSKKRKLSDPMHISVPKSKRARISPVVSTTIHPHTHTQTPKLCCHSRTLTHTQARDIYSPGSYDVYVCVYISESETESRLDSDSSSK